MSLLASLNPQQREAVQCTEGPLLLLAGAGSGKTRVVVTRIAHLILDKGVSPSAILAVTFTNKAAEEMRERVGQLLEASGQLSGRLPTVATFHSFCVRLLRQYGAPLKDLRPGFASDFLIYDEGDQTSTINAARKTIGPEASSIKARTVLTAISRAKHEGSRKLLRGQNEQETEILNRLYELYEAELRQANALDFDDLLLEAVRLLRGFEEVRAAVRDRYRYLLVDEYQDTNRVQYDLVRLLSQPRCNVCVVGDEDQSIYSWRGADIGNILGFETDFPAAQLLRLEQNYRSTGGILAAASALVEHNRQRKGKRLWTEAPAGEPPVVYRLSDGEAEARLVAREAGRLVDEDPTARVGILYRTNAQSRLLEEALQRDGRAFVLVGGLAFYERAEIKDLLAYVKAALAPGDAASLRRILNVPARGIGKTTLDRLQEHSKRRQCSLWQAIEETVQERLLTARTRSALSSFCQLMRDLRREVEKPDLPTALEWILERTGYREMLQGDSSDESKNRLDNLRELGVAASEAAERGESWVDFLDKAALIADTDDIDRQARVSLLTLHNAKGLEFPAVVIVGMEEGLLPHQRSVESLEDSALEEERRLCYVGMTRAQRRLILTYATRRRLYGGGPALYADPSRFLGEIPPTLLDDRSRRRSLQRGSSNVFQQAAALSDEVSAPTHESRNGSGAIRSHDSIEAIAGFFQDRGIKLDLSAASGSAPAASQSSPAPSLARPREPRLGQAVKALRSQGQFAKGTKVRHRKFGVGVVQRREGEGSSAKLTVYFRNYGLRKLVAGFANLQEL